MSGDDLLQETEHHQSQYWSSLHQDKGKIQAQIDGCSAISTSTCWCSPGSTCCLWGRRAFFAAITRFFERRVANLTNSGLGGGGGGGGGGAGELSVSSTIQPIPCDTEISSKVAVDQASYGGYTAASLYHRLCQMFLQISRKCVLNLFDHVVRDCQWWSWARIPHSPGPVSWRPFPVVWLWTDTLTFSSHSVSGR